MENASQALFMAAGVLIAIMVISIGVYLFSSASRIAESYETTMSSNEIQQFNSKFEKYARKANYIKEEIDRNGNKVYKYSNDYVDGSVFHDYNTISDVVSAMNLAYSINSKNNYDLQSGIQVTISGEKADGWEYKILGITPSIQKLFVITKDKNDKNNCYPISYSGRKVLDSEAKKPIASDLYSFNELLIKYNNSKLDNTNTRVYEYGFKGELLYNKDTRLVDIIKFTLIKNDYFDLL